jgi:hypothetical protein
MRNNTVCITSLDFELPWGAREQLSILDFRGNVRGLVNSRTESTTALANPQGIWRRRDVISKSIAEYSLC